MNNRQRILAAIEHRQVDRIPLMYRGLPETTRRLRAYLGLDTAAGSMAFREPSHDTAGLHYNNL